MDLGEGLEGVLSQFNSDPYADRSSAQRTQCAFDFHINPLSTRPIVRPPVRVYNRGSK